MTHTADSGFIGDLPPRRRSAQPAPLDVWTRAVFVVMTLWSAATALFVFLWSPMPATVDTQLYATQFADLDRQVSAAEGKGERPLTIVFLGTSRMRNVALDSAAVAAAARAAGVTRPVASTVLGVNWGGFERFGPALPMIERHRPDVVAIMPELLDEDYTWKVRAQLGFGRLQSAMWGKPFSPFAVGETTMQVCLGFTQPPQERDAQNRSFMEIDPNSPGPRQARDFIRRMTAQGSQVLVADVPVSRELAAIRPAERPVPSTAAVAEIHTPVERAAYCDFAHIDPRKADDWRQPFFREIAGRLNGLAR